MMDLFELLCNEPIPKVRPESAINDEALVKEYFIEFLSRHGKQVDQEVIDLLAAIYLDPPPWLPLPK